MPVWTQEADPDLITKRMAVVVDDHLTAALLLGTYVSEDEALAFEGAVDRIEAAKRALHDEIPAHFEVLTLAVNIVADLAPEKWQELQRAVAETHVLEASLAARFPDDVDPAEVFGRYRATSDSVTWEILSLKRYLPEKPE